jgi:AcrR family transcriptional regulator
VASLKIVPRQGGYARGRDVFEQILRAAFDVWVEHGADAMTLRRIAAKCDMKSGNINYYFPSKQELIRELLDAIITSYEGTLDEIIADRGATPERQLEGIVTFVLDDIRSKETTRIFPELWAMTNHDRFVSDRVDELYKRGRAQIDKLISEINPELPADERDALALFMSGSMEGMTIFAGHDKPWCDRMAWLERIARASFVQLAKDMRPGYISGIVAPPSKPPRARKGRAPKPPSST